MTKRQILALSALYNLGVASIALARPKLMRRLAGLHGDSWSPLEEVGLLLILSIGSGYGFAALEDKPNRPIEIVCATGKPIVSFMVLRRARRGELKPLGSLLAVPDLFLGLGLAMAGRK